MGASKTSVNPNKRKKAVDMADSPPKRVTRSRAKVAEDVPEPELPIKTTKIKTASAKAATAKSSLTKAHLTKSATTTQRKTRANDQVDNGTLDQVMAAVLEPTKSVEAKTRSRRKKASQEEENVSGTVVAPTLKTRTRAERPKTNPVANPVTETVPATTTNVKVPATKAARAVVSTVSKTEKEKPSARVTKKVTRGTIASIGTRSLTSAISKAPIARKKVTFQEGSEQDKENQPVTVPKKSGIGAKPIRKPAATKSATRKGKVAPVKEVEKENDVVQAKPLSPKKVLQVARSLSSEDELAVGKSPARPIAQSPRKPPTSIFKEPEQAHTSALMNVSPKKPLTASALMASPARRPPPSPFRGAIKESPKRLDLGSPKKFILGTAALGVSVPQPECTSKASLLQSPAKRPASPTRFLAPASLGKTTTATEGQDQPSEPSRHSPLKVTRFTPHKISSTPLRASQASSRPLMDQDSQLLQTIMQDASPPKEIEEVTTSTNAEEESTTPPGTPQNALLGASSVFSTSMLARSVGDIPVHNPTEKSTPLQTEQGMESSLMSDDTNNEAALLEASTGRCPQRWTGKDLPSSFRLNRDDPMLRSDESESEDELQSPFKAGTLRSYSHGSAGTPTPSEASRKRGNTSGRSSFHRTMTSVNSGSSMTPLATQLSSWLASSPDKKAPRISQSSSRRVFSPIGLKLFGQVPRLTQTTQQPSPLKSISPLKSSFFEEEMMALDQEETLIEVHEDEQAIEEKSTSVEAPEGSFESHCSTGSDQYGDENAMPIDPRILQSGAEGNVEVLVVVETCTPARVFYSNPREIHTVSKVPIRPPADDSPDLFSRKRSRSLSSPSKPHGIFKNSSCLTLSAERTDEPKSPEGSILTEVDVEKLLTPKNPEETESTGTPLPTTPLGGTWSNLTTPTRSVRRGTDAQILRGAVVYVDVHTTEGADASAIFVELLTSMGARCVKQWNWNPRAGLGTTSDDVKNGQDSASATPNNKVGITHVVFKDGGKRTLEKVRESNGLVSCVGVGWVLNCEQQNQWVEEKEYAVDLSLIPRGGHRRRKSMEPGRLSNFNGSLVPADPTLMRPCSTDMSPTKDFLNLSSPSSSRRETLGPESPIFHQQFPDASQADQLDSAPMTPRPETPLGMRSPDAESSFGSPTTPFYLSKQADLLQKTCPPKQKFQSILQGDHDDDEEGVRQRLDRARRKTLQWAPRIESPLGRWGGN